MRTFKDPLEVIPLGKSGPGKGKYRPASYTQLEDLIMRLDDVYGDGHDVMSLIFITRKQWDSFHGTSRRIGNRAVRVVALLQVIYEEIVTHFLHREMRDEDPLAFKDVFISKHRDDIHELTGHNMPHFRQAQSRAHFETGKGVSDGVTEHYRPRRATIAYLWKLAYDGKLTKAMCDEICLKAAKFHVTTKLENRILKTFTDAKKHSGLNWRIAYSACGVHLLTTDDEPEEILYIREKDQIQAAERGIQLDAGIN